jgi:hypothetical protein
MSARPDVKEADSQRHESRHPGTAKVSRSRTARGGSHPGPAELALLERVDGTRSARVLLKEAELPAVEAQRALLILLSLGLADFPA